jgi:hypothetical protein
MAHKCAIRMAGSNDRCIQPSRQSADLGELAAGSSGGLERAVGRGQGAVGVLAEILVARRVEQVEGEPLMLKAHHRLGDRDATLALDRHPIRAHPPPLAARLHFARQLDRPPNSSNFSVNVVLPASGCEMIANVRRRKISSVRVLIELHNLLRPPGDCSQADPSPRIDRCRQVRQLPKSPPTTTRKGKDVG